MTVTVHYNPLTKDVEVAGSAGLDIVGIVGILELAKTAIVARASRK